MDHSHASFAFKSHIFLSKLDGVSFVMHILEADKDGVFVSTFKDPTDSSEEEIGEQFVSGLNEVVEFYPEVMICESRRDDAWVNNFCEMVNAAYEESDLNSFPIEFEDLPQIVRLEFESRLRDLDQQADRIGSC